MVINDKTRKTCDRYRYKVFGLHVVSDLLLPELLTVVDTADTPEVSISVGKVSAIITNPVEKTDTYQVAKNQFLLQIPGVGCYYVTNGSHIIVEPDRQAEPRFLRLFLLGTVFGALLMQREIFPIHGSAVVFSGGCVIFTGISGAGKSTLLAAFREKGYSFLTDDVAAVTVDENGLAWVHSAYPQQKLWRDSAETIGVDTASLTPVYIGINKDKFNIPVHKGFWQLPTPLAAIYELNTERGRGVSIAPLTGTDKLAVLMNHTYRPWLLGGLGLKAVHFRHCAAITSQVAVSRLTRPEGIFSLDEQVRLVQQDLARLLAGRAV